MADNIAQVKTIYIERVDQKKMRGIDNKELIIALEDLEKEKGIKKEYLLESIETALVTAYKKNFDANENVNKKLFFKSLVMTNSNVESLVAGKILRNYYVYRKCL